MTTIDQLVYTISSWFPPGHLYASEWNIYASLGIILVSLICGSLGGLVVGNRMAFFSDAIAHCAWAGVSLGLILSLIADIPDDVFRQSITAIMVGFGILVGLAIAWVRDRTGLASDTVIGVFFALAVGLGAVSTRLVARRRRMFNVESFIFGEPLGAQAIDILILFVLLVVTGVFLIRYYNQLILTSVHPSLAMSRRVPVTLLRYLLVVLLGVVINVCLQVVGTLLINGLLIVPAAAAANLSRDMRRHFWFTLAITVACGLGGQFLSFEIGNRLGDEPHISGTILVLACLTFLATLFLGPHWRRQRAAG